VIERQQIDPDSLFQGSARESIDQLGDIEVDITAARYEITGDIEIQGDVPEDVLLEVQGSVEVRGFAGGHIHATQGITVHGNTSGAYILSDDGDIAIDKILAGATVIARNGEIQTQRIEDPACLFGWNGVRIAGDAVGGRLMGRTVSITGQAAGVEIHAVDRIEAGAFASLQRSLTVLCLRGSIRSEEIGRVMEDDERKLLRGMGKHRYTERTMARLMAYATRDLENSLRSALYFLLAGARNANVFRVFHALMGQSNAANELHAITERLCGFYSDLGENNGDMDIEAAVNECAQRLHTVKDTIEALSNSVDLQHKTVILSACEEHIADADHLKSDGAAQDAADYQKRLAGKSMKWKALQEELAQEIAEVVESLDMDPKIMKAVELRPDRVEHMVDQVIQRFQAGGTTDQVNRTRSPLLRVFRKTAETKRDQIRKWNKSAQEARGELDRVKETLESKSAVLFSGVEGGLPIAVANRFAAGVQFAATRGATPDPVNEPDLAHELAAPVEHRSQFNVRGSKIVETNPD
jgi:hypothetical protein